MRRNLACFASAILLASCAPSAPNNSGPQENSPAAAALAGQGSVEPAVNGRARHLRLISQAQYSNTIKSIFGSQAVPAFDFAAFERTDGLVATGAAYEGLTDAHVEKYQRAATRIAQLIVSPSQRTFVLPCLPNNPQAADTACSTKFLSSVGRRLLRRPLPNDKLAEIVKQADEGATRLGDFYAGLRVSLEALLMSPKMLYIEEIPESNPASPGAMRLDGYSIASRLSFFLWNMAPDDALLDAAAEGELNTLQGRAKAVDRMLASPHLEVGVRAFFDDMFGFDSFVNLAKDAAVYPAFTGAAVDDAREQTLRLLVDHLITNKRDYRDIFTTRTTFISPTLAAIYRVPSFGGWTRVDEPYDSPRAGLLTQIGFLALNSHPARSSPTLRGKALREVLLCQPVPRPPANVDFSAIENPDPRLRTARERLKAHAENPVCGGCHKITDPMGLALEHFDGSGAYRETEKGAPIDVSGNLDGKPFTDVIGLGQVLHDHPAVPSCLVRRTYSYAVGGRVPREEQPVINYLNERFAAEGFEFPALLRTIALSNAFVAVDGSEARAAHPGASPEKVRAQ